MTRSDELLKKAGATLHQSASVRPGPVGMASVAGASVGRDSRKDGLDRSKTAWTIPIEKIARDPNQPREEVQEGEVETLAESLRTHGLIQPITVMWSEEAGLYRIVAGERRFKAATVAGWTSISCNILDKPLAPDELLALQCVENLLRQDLKPIEQAKAFRTLLTVNGWNIARLSRELGVSHSGISQSLRLLALPDEIQERVEAGELAPVSAYHVAKIEDPDVQAEVAGRVISEGLSRDETVEAVRQVIDKQPRKAKGKVAKGRGAAKSKAGTKVKPTRLWVARTTSGPHVVVQSRKAFDLPTVLAALVEATAKVRADIAATVETPVEPEAA
jgi:ParB family chromosome partitioning protein